MFAVYLALLIYAVGAGVGLVFTDARPLGRIALALLWPIGPLAFLVTVAILLAASLIAFPVVGVIVAAGLLALLVLAA